MNRFKKNNLSKTNTISEFYGHSWFATFAHNPAWKYSDRLRQEALFTNRFIHCNSGVQTQEQRTLICELNDKFFKENNGGVLDGSEPRITAEEFEYWGIRYPVG